MNFPYTIFLPLGGGVGGIPGTGGGVSLNSACHPNPCMNGGSCTENGGGYDCACVVQYSGPNCESKCPVAFGSHSMPLTQVMH